MDLKQYLESEGALTALALSRIVGVTPGRITHVKVGMGCSPDLALKIEEATGGLVDAGKIAPVVKKARETAPKKRRIKK